MASDTATKKHWEGPVSILALLVSVASVATGLLVFYQPRIEEEQARSDRIADFLNAVTAVGRLNTSKAGNVVAAGSPADSYTTALGVLWDGARWAQPDIGQGQEGSFSGDGETYSVCLPEVDFLISGCHNYANFQFSDAGRSIQSFSIDGMPVDELIWTPDSTLDTMNTLTFPLSAYKAGGLLDPDLQAASIALVLAPRDTDAPDSSVWVDVARSRVQDRTEADLSSADFTAYIRTPITHYAQYPATFRINTFPDGFIFLCLQDLPDSSCGWVFLR